MSREDKSSFVIHKLAAILEACKKAESKTEFYLVTSDEKPDLIPELFQILNSVDDLLELVNPSKTVGEYHGLSRQETTLGFSRILFSHLDKPEWDFTAWFGEKVSQIKFFTKNLIEYWEMDYREVKLGPGALVTPKEYVRDEIVRNLGSIKAYAQLVFDEVLNDRLEIEEISTED